MRGWSWGTYPYKFKSIIYLHYLAKIVVEFDKIMEKLIKEIISKKYTLHTPKK